MPMFVLRGKLWKLRAEKDEPHRPERFCIRNAAPDDFYVMPGGLKCFRVLCKRDDPGNFGEAAAHRSDRNQRQ